MVKTVLVKTVLVKKVLVKKVLVKKMLVKTVLVEAATGKFIIGLLVKQSRIHGYPSRVRMGKDSIWVIGAFGQEQWSQRPQKHKEK